MSIHNKSLSRGLLGPYSLTLDTELQEEQFLKTLLVLYARVLMERSRINRGRRFYAGGIIKRWETKSVSRDLGMTYTQDTNKLILTLTVES